MALFLFVHLLVFQLLVNNEIGKERAAKLRRKYNELRDNLET